MGQVADGGGSAGEALYRRLAALLRADIESGVLRANDLLLSERELAAKSGMSRETVRKAVRLLEAEGVLHSQQGRGTYVTPPAVREMTRHLDGFSADTRKRGGVAGQIILFVGEVPASIAVAGVLQIEPHRMVTRVKRVRTIDGQRVGLQDSHLLLPATISDPELRQAGSLYALIGARFGIEATEGLESVGSIAATGDDAALLEVAPGAPLLLCERITLSQRRQPFEYCDMRYVSSYRYTARIHRSGPTSK